MNMLSHFYFKIITFLTGPQLKYVHQLTFRSPMKRAVCVFDLIVLSSFFFSLFGLLKRYMALEKCIAIFFARAHLCSKSSLKTYFSSDFMVESVEIAQIDGNYVEIYSKALLPLCD